MERRRLKILLLLLFVALAIPTAILVFQAYGQLKWEAFHRQQQLAREFALRVDRQFSTLMEREESRAFTDYAFLNVASGSNFLQRSPLAAFPLDSAIPGILGYFQVDAEGQLATPTLPPARASDYGIDSQELGQRQALEDRIRVILNENRLVKKSDEKLAQTLSSKTTVEQSGRVDGAREESAVAESVASLPAAAAEDKDAAMLQGQLVFDQLKNRGNRQEIGKLNSDPSDDIKSEDTLAESPTLFTDAPTVAKLKSLNKQARRETSVLPEALVESEAVAERDMAALAEGESEPSLRTRDQQALRIRIFETEIDPMEFSLLDSGHFVLFRRVWHDGKRYVQGLLIDPELLLEGLIEPAFRESLLSTMSELVVAYQGEVIRLFGVDRSSVYSPTLEKDDDELLYQSRLVAPFSDLELIFKLSRLPVSDASRLISWVASIFALVLIGGFLLLYRLGSGAIALAQQQQDFVSAVSHELKTPLTSIRMYGEMLREGWADEARKKSYYDFIFNESERLSRLINNVLHLARMSRNEQKPNLEEIDLETLIAELRPRLELQLENAGFSLAFDAADTDATTRLNLDRDWLTQILINLVDNAIKFSAKTSSKQVRISIRKQADRSIQIGVRDFGPGVAKDQMKKIFRLFYRSENELTRETVGTGIGLALVHQLVTGMGGEVDLVNCDPGVEFQLRFLILPAREKV